MDSPLAVEATNIFRDHQKECYDSDAAALLAQGINPILFPGLKLSITSDESKAINFNETPKVIISASGMCDAGRIKHHLKHNLWRPECTVLFVGYQAVGTLGRKLNDGEKTVKIFGDEIAVHAEITVLPGVSGHADKAGLLRWLNAMEQKPAHVFVNHGDDDACTAFSACLREEYGYEADAPYNGAVWIVSDGRAACAETGNTQKIVKTRTEANVRTSAAYDRLVNMGQRLMEVIRHNQGGANKDLAKFASQIASLCDKWDR